MPFVFFTAWQCIFEKEQKILFSYRNDDTVNCLIKLNNGFVIETLQLIRYCHYLHSKKHRFKRFFSHSLSMKSLISVNRTLLVKLSKQPFWWSNEFFFLVEKTIKLICFGYVPRKKKERVRDHLYFTSKVNDTWCSLQS